MTQEEVLKLCMEKYSGDQRVVFEFGAKTAIELMWEDMIASFEDKEIRQKSSKSDVYNSLYREMYVQTPHVVAGGHYHIPAPVLQNTNDTTNLIQDFTLEEIAELRRSIDAATQITEPTYYVTEQPPTLSQENQDRFREEVRALTAAAGIRAGTTLGGQDTE